MNAVREQARKKALQILPDENMLKEDSFEYDEYKDDVEGLLRPDLGSPCSERRR